MSQNVPSPDQAKAPPAEQPPEPLSWRSWPLHDHPARGVVLIISLTLMTWGIYWLSGQAYLSMAALAAILASLWRFFLPIHFALNKHGVDQGVLRRRRRIPWNAIDRYKVCSSGMLLLPDEDNSAMAPFRGLYLPWTTHRDEIHTFLRHYMGPPASSENDPEAGPGPAA